MIQRERLLVLQMRSFALTGARLECLLSHDAQLRKGNISSGCYRLLGSAGAPFYPPCVGLPMPRSFGAVQLQWVVARCR